MDTLDTPGDAPDVPEAASDRGKARPSSLDRMPADEMHLLADCSAPFGASPQAVRLWFDATAEALKPDADGSLTSAKASALAYRSRAKADNTRSAYRSAVRAWCAWCATHGLIPLPASPLDVAAFLAQERDRGLAANTIDLRRAAIRFLHRAAGCASPTEDSHVAETLAGIHRDAPNPIKKRAATLSVLRELLAPIPVDASAPGGLAGLRDRALLLVGFAGALRRSELAGIRIADLERTDRGFGLTLPRSKGSQSAAVTVPLPYGRTELCPVRALSAWLAAASIAEGAVFRRLWLPPSAGEDGTPALPVLGTEALTTRSIGRIVQARAAAAGFVGREFGGHSLKRGALSAGMELGAHAAQLKRLGRHKSFDVLGEYLEFGNLFDNHPLGAVL